MDTVEVARQIASQLHLNAVRAGNDPSAPYVFVLAQAQLLGLDVEPTAKGAAILDGGRATFLSADRLILHENSGSLFEQAFLVAHEIGHVVLGDDVESEPAHEVDPARTAEPSPVGFDRVVDYGRKQRREIQMDLFAREFLLPRSWVRTLHVNDGLTASQIATQVGAPFAVVAQQLFDALLLPSMETDATPSTQELPLNKKQDVAAGHRGEAYLLEAGPGTGKTRTLVARIEGLLLDGVDPRRILVLTFSNKAAGEMAERIARKHKDAAAAMWIGTFHAFGLDLIRRFYAELGLPRDPGMMDRTEAVELLEERFPGFSLNHYRNIYDPTQIIVDILAAVSRAKDEVVNAAEYRRLAEAMGPTEAGERAREVASVYEAYEALKRNAQCIDFGDLVLLPVQLLEQNLAVRTHLQSLYDHVIVDEYQDVNRSSVRLLSALKPDGRNLWVVGDAKQSIYRFRGASPYSMRRFGFQDFPDGIRGRLDRNYRSAEEIVTAFSVFAVTMQVGGEVSTLDSQRGPNGFRPELRTVRQSAQQAVAVADVIEEMRSAGHPYKEQAVLCTGNDRLSDLGRDLELLGIPVLFLGSLFERPEIKDLLSLLSLFTDRRAMGLVRVACWPEFRMCLQDVAAVLAFLRSTDPDPARWISQVDAIPSITDGGRQSLKLLAAALDGFDRTSSPWAVIATLLLDRTRIAAKLAISGHIADRARAIAIWQFLNFLRVQPTGQGLPINRLLERVRRLIRLGDDRDLRQLPYAAQGLDAVRLMTIHGSKGLEFPIVHIPGMSADTIPRTSAPPSCQPPDGMIEGITGTPMDAIRSAQHEEQECLFYVALSRAQDRLFLYAPTEKSNSHNRPLSPFLDRLGPMLDRRNPTPERTLPHKPESLSIPLVVDGPLRFEGPQLSLYETCPRRFFYTHILQVGGRRSSTAFMKMHEAVRTVVSELLAEPDTVTDASLKEKMEVALDRQGLAEHGYRPEFATLAMTMLRFFVSTQAGCQPQETVALKLRFGVEEISVRADDMLIRTDGRRVLRRIRTGHARSSETKDVSAAAFLLAVREAFPEAVVELVHLADGESRPIVLSARELQTRHGKLQSFLKDIRSGSFPTDATSFSCPGCPAFFICGPVPGGTLQKIFP